MRGKRHSTAGRGSPAQLRDESGCQRSRSSSANAAQLDDGLREGATQGAKVCATDANLTAFQRPDFILLGDAIFARIPESLNRPFPSWCSSAAPAIDCNSWAASSAGDAGSRRDPGPG